MIYLDNAATSRFKPKATLNATLKALKNQSNPGRSSHTDAINSALECYKIREKIKHFFHCEGGNAVFTKNCTEALNLAILGSIPKNARIVTTVAEHNSVLRPLYKLAKEKNIKIVTLPLSRDGHVPPYRVENALNTDTYMLILNHVSNVNGVKSNLFEIGKITAKRGVKFLVDGAQSAGHEPINMQECNIDMLALPAHKGLLAPQGLGILLFNDRISLSPLLLGGTGTNSESVYHPKDAPEAYEAGTLNFPAIAGLGKSLEYLEENGKRITDTVKKLTSDLLYGLKQIKSVTLYTPDNALGGVVSFNVSNLSSSTVSDILSQKYDIATRSGLHCAPLMHNFLGTLEQGTVRASIGAGNTARDIEKLLIAVERIAKEK